MTSARQDKLPWEDIPLPTSPGSLRTKLALFNGRAVHKIYYAVDYNGNYLLEYILPHDCREQFNIKLRGFNVTRKIINQQPGVIVELLNRENASFFYNICIQLGEYLDYFDEEHGPQAFNDRLIYLQSFFKPRSDALSKEEQRGLIAELLILKNLLLKHYNLSSAVSMWTGIEGLPQDFANDSFLLEVKSIFKAEKRHIIISSPKQLDSRGNKLYLAVVYMAVATMEVAGSFSLYSLIRDLQATLKQDYNALDVFNLKLSQKIPNIIFDTDLLEKNYDRDYYLLTDIVYYDTTGDFPKVLPQDLPEAVISFKYEINLDKCADYLVTEEALFA